MNLLLQFDVYLHVEAWTVIMKIVISDRFDGLQYKQDQLKC